MKRVKMWLKALQKARKLTFFFGTATKVKNKVSPPKKTARVLFLQYRASSCLSLGATESLEQKAVMDNMCSTPEISLCLRAFQNTIKERKETENTAHIKKKREMFVISGCKLMCGEVDEENDTTLMSVTIYLAYLSMKTEKQGSGHEQSINKSNCHHLLKALIKMLYLNMYKKWRVKSHHFRFYEGGAWDCFLASCSALQ